MADPLSVSAALIVANLCAYDPGHPVLLLSSPLSPPRLTAAMGDFIFGPSRAYEVLYETQRGRPYRVIIQTLARRDGSVDFFTPSLLPGCTPVG